MRRVSRDLILRDIQKKKEEKNKTRVSAREERLVFADQLFRVVRACHVPRVKSDDVLMTVCVYVRACASYKCNYYLSIY